MSEESNQISPKVHRYLYTYSVKRFLDTSIENFDQYMLDSGVDMTQDLAYSRLLDSALADKKISNADVNTFLLNELNYGRAKNVYISFIQEVSHLYDEKKIIEAINRLKSKDIEKAEEVKSLPFLNNLRGGVPQGEDQLIYANTEKDEQGTLTNIKFLIAQGFIDSEGSGTNNYIGVEINLQYKMLVVKLRNWESNSEQNYGMDTLHKRIQDIVKNCFNLSIPLLTATTQKLVFDMVNELSGKVLDPSVRTVQSILEEEIEEKISDWTGKILSEGVFLPSADINVFKQSILNNFYRIYMQNEIGVVKVGELKDRFDVNGYPRYVKFMDDTIGEGRAKSPDPRESLLDTSIFYDIKARLDQAKQIKMATVYWVDSPGYDYLGTTFYTDNQERFKFVVLANFFTKEICDYVLQQVDKYHRQRS